MSETMEFVLTCLAIVGIVILLRVPRWLMRKQAMRKISEQFNSLEDFLADKHIIGSDIKSGIAIDENRKKICLIKRHHKNISCNILSYGDILSSEIFENAKKRYFGKVKVKQIGLRLTVNSTDSPLHEIQFAEFSAIGSEEVAKRGKEAYDKEMEEVRRWHGLIDVIIHRSNN